MARVFSDETPALEQGDLPVQRALRETGDGEQIFDRHGLAMTGECRQHQQHPFSPCHTLFRVHDENYPQ